MKKIAQEIINILKGELNIYREMLSVLESERTFLINFNVERIFEVSKKKETLAVQLKVLEETRRQILKTYADESGIDFKSLTLSIIAERLDNGLKSDIINLRDEIRSIVERCFELNRHNSYLIQNSLGLLQQSLSIFKDTLSDSGPYQKGVKITKKQRRNLISKKA